MAKAPVGRFCPHCNATLQVSKANWIYCPNKYKASPPCPFKGQKAGGNTARGAGQTNESIPLLTTLSDEQQAVIDRVADFT